MQVTDDLKRPCKREREGLGIKGIQKKNSFCIGSMGKNNLYKKKRLGGKS